MYGKKDPPGSQAYKIYVGSSRVKSSSFTFVEHKKAPRQDVVCLLFRHRASETVMPGRAVPG